jgi:hypothetical protein
MDFCTAIAAEGHWRLNLHETLNGTTTSFCVELIFLFMRWIPRLPGFLCLLGRNSLSVFCALSLLSLSGQIFRFIFGGHVASDAFIVILGVLLLGFIAWAAEWRERSRAALANKPLSP